MRLYIARLEVNLLASSMHTLLQTGCCYSGNKKYIGVLRLCNQSHKPYFAGSVSKI